MSPDGDRPLRVRRDEQPAFVQRLDPAGRLVCGGLHPHLGRDGGARSEARLSCRVRNTGLNHEIGSAIETGLVIGAQRPEQVVVRRHDRGMRHRDGLCGRSPRHDAAVDGRAIGQQFGAAEHVTDQRQGGLAQDNGWHARPRAALDPHGQAGPAQQVRAAGGCDAFPPDQYAGDPIHHCITM